MRNDVELTKKIVEIVEGFHANPYIKQIEELMYAPEDMKNDKFEEGYNWALRDVLSILRGER